MRYVLSRIIVLLLAPCLVAELAVSAPHFGPPISLTDRASFQTEALDLPELSSGQFRRSVSQSNRVEHSFGNLLSSNRNPAPAQTKGSRPRLNLADPSADIRAIVRELERAPGYNRKTKKAALERAAEKLKTAGTLEAAAGIPEIRNVIPKDVLGALRSRFVIEPGSVVSALEIEDLLAGNLPMMSDSAPHRRFGPSSVFSESREWNSSRIRELIAHPPPRSAKSEAQSIRLPETVIDANPVYARRTRSVLNDTQFRPWLEALAESGIRTIRFERAEDYHFYVDRTAQTLVIQLGPVPDNILGYCFLACSGALRALGRTEPLRDTYDMGMMDDPRASVGGKIVSLPQPLWDFTALRTALDDFLFQQNHLLQALSERRGETVRIEDIDHIEYKVIQMGSHQVILRITLCVSWQNTPLNLVASVAKAPVGRRILTSTADSALLDADTIAQEEAANQAAHHAISPDLYDAPYAAAHGHYGRGENERIFISLMPYKEGVYELEPVLSIDPDGRVRHHYRLNAAHEVELDGAPVRIWMPVADASTAAVDRANVAAIVRHWARGYVRTGRGLYDPAFVFRSGDENIEADLGEEEATVPDDALTWRMAARGQGVLSPDELVDHLMAPVQATQIHAPGGDVDSYDFLAGDPGDQSTREERVFEGVIRGFAQSGLPDAQRASAELELWRSYLRHHDAQARAVLIGLTRWLVFLRGLHVAMITYHRESGAPGRPDLPTETLKLWLNDVLFDKEWPLGLTGTALCDRLTSWWIERTKMPPEQAAFLSEFWRRATYASRADGDFPFLPPETYWLAEEHLAIKNLIVKFSWTIAEQSEAGMTAVLGKIQGYLTHDTLTRLARERIYRWPDRAA